MNKAAANPNFYLSPGEQTKISPRILEISQNFHESGLDLIFEILNWLHRHIKLNESEKEKYFRKRTAEEIIQDGFATGCTDYALVFLVLIKSKNLPAKYVEAVSRDWLEKGDEKKIEGHVFVEVFLNNKWRIIDPRAGVIKAWYGKRFEIFNKGLDSWDLGIRNINDLREKFQEFKKRFLGGR